MPQNLRFLFFFFKRIAAALDFLALQSGGDFLQQSGNRSLRAIGRHPSCCATT